MKRNRTHTLFTHEHSPFRQNKRFTLVIPATKSAQTLRFAPDSHKAWAILSLGITLNPRGHYPRDSAKTNVRFARSLASHISFSPRATASASQFVVALAPTIAKARGLHHQLDTIHDHSQHPPRCYATSLIATIGTTARYRRLTPRIDYGTLASPTPRPPALLLFRPCDFATLRLCDL